MADLLWVSQKANIYSFGMLLLELLTGKASTDAVLYDKGVDHPRWARSTVKEEWMSPWCGGDDGDGAAGHGPCMEPALDQWPVMPEIMARIEGLGGTWSVSTAQSLTS
ncbi:unnamed protein product [Miscanthus lutarioriparius]|uniref:Serine-threonine/tyrosine-protein kinase catalytic domain-containing protein n=1 Tax=Miscanthus lutarioriparius TaxID=422564 RepID=A0A811Q876_9POAL|nr:unnamed protein product [Miscanthus lutarioriparius]